MLREGQLKSHYRNGLVAGSIIALLASVYASLNFRPGLLELPFLVAWHTVSLLFGGVAGLVAGFLVSQIPVRMNPIVSHLAGALFGAFGFYLQMYLFLLYMFRTYPTSF